MNIHFEKMTVKDIPLWERWITIPHVKEVWFIEGYETSDYIYQKIQGNGHTYPFIIYSPYAAAFNSCSSLNIT